MWEDKVGQPIAEDVSNMYKLDVLCLIWFPVLIFQFAVYAHIMRLQVLLFTQRNPFQFFMFCVDYGCMYLIQLSHVTRAAMAKGKGKVDADGAFS